MSQEQNFDVVSWWNGLAFDGKELFTLNDDGQLYLHAGDAEKERLIASFTEENCEAEFNALREKYALLQSKVAELAAEWATIEDKTTIADKVFSLKRQITETAMLGDLNLLQPELATWEQAINSIYEENYAIKLQLAEQAEALANGDEWKEASIAMKEVVDLWKASGHTDKRRSDKLWHRIEDARTKFNERKQQFFEEQEKDLLVNLDLKLDLVEQAESLTESKEWKKTSETFHRLTTEWKTIGHTLNKKNEELWQRFIAAKSAFFDRKREHTDKIQKEQEESYQQKLSLVEQAEALQDSKEWGKTAQAFGTLMAEWKKTGRVGGEKGEELWNRYNAAQEKFFSAKKAHTEDIRQMHEENLGLKQELIRRAHQIKNSSSWGNTTAEMNELLEEWKAIGPVAREISNKIWDEFLAARKHFFARKDENRELRKEYYETQKETRIIQAKEALDKLLEDIAEEENKLVDFKEALGNITPGKKAAELRKHLENLLVEGEQKIKRFKEKHAALKDEYGKSLEKAKAEKEAKKEAEKAEVKPSEIKEEKAEEKVSPIEAKKEVEVEKETIDSDSAPTPEQGPEK